MSYTITRGSQLRPLKAVMYGAEGIGKTTFAAAWPDPVFIDIEDGSGLYDVARIDRPTSWRMLLEEVNELRVMDGFSTVVVDTADAAEALCVRHVLRENNKQSIESFGYGKGYTMLAEEFAKLLSALDGCVAAGKNVLVLAHATIRKFEQPDEMGAYDRWELKLSKKCSPLVKEWSDLLLFANYRNDLMKGEDGKLRATGGKRRMMYASHSATYDAKNRLGLPDSMPMDFASIADKVPAAQAIAAKPAKPKRKKPEPVATATVADHPEAVTVEQVARDLGADVEEVTPPEVTKLLELMERDGVKEVELRHAVAERKRNPYTENDTIADYDPKFIKTTLIGHWDAILKTVADNREVYKDIPF